MGSGRGRTFGAVGYFLLHHQPPTCQQSANITRIAHGVSTPGNNGGTYWQLHSYRSQPERENGRASRLERFNFTVGHGTTAVATRMSLESMKRQMTTKYARTRGILDAHFVNATTNFQFHLRLIGQVSINL